MQKKRKPIRIQQKKANKNSTGLRPEPPTTVPTGTAPPRPLSQCEALGGICSGSSGGASIPYASVEVPNR